jgi:hypothetical protein
MGAFFSVAALGRALRPDDEQLLIKRQFRRLPGEAMEDHSTVTDA